MLRLHVRVAGRVQGVGFRWFVREEARRLGLSGWVVNLPTGDVELCVAGEDSMVQRLRTAIGVGPDAAQVSGVHDAGECSDKSLPYPFAIKR